ncbi:MAG: hypothetical protein IPN94_23795 [Sphingobacteriales bacterium]|nr:hypothetical protein [Sphingobacteriales bacterium]
MVSNTIDSNSGGTNLGSGSGAQTANAYATNCICRNGFYYCVINQTGSGCGQLTSNTADVIINDYPITTGVTICQGGSGTLAQHQLVVVLFVNVGTTIIVPGCRHRPHCSTSNSIDT